MSGPTIYRRPDTERDGWPTGPWDHEPDKVSWADEATGLPCLIVRNHMGALCGYVGVDPTHPWHGIGYSECTKACGEDWCDHSPLTLTDGGHGELTYAAGCQTGQPEDSSICHIPAPGESDDVWWFGFDCAHYGDFVPGMDRYASFGDGVYRDVAYVTACCASLAGELAAVGG